jgi:predicted deacylase
MGRAGRVGGWVAALVLGAGSALGADASIPDFASPRLAPGQLHRTWWAPSETFAGVSLETPILVARGVEIGPTLCLTAGIHGDELNGIEIVRRVMERIDPKELRGTLVGVPIVNLHGFRRSSRYLPDRRDLNRYFPGRARGSSASRIAHAFFEQVVSQCDFLVDMHTGSFHRTNLPQVRANFGHPGSPELARSFGGSLVVHSVGTAGTLRRAANEAGIPAITFEGGEPMRFEVAEVERGVAGVMALMRTEQMIPGGAARPRSEVFEASRWVRVDEGGILISEVALGAEVEVDRLLGTVTDPITNERGEVRAPFAGRVIGMALNQVVIPGFAAYHIGIRDLPTARRVPGDEDWGPEAVEEVDEGGGDERPE